MAGSRKRRRPASLCSIAFGFHTKKRQSKVVTFSKDRSSDESRKNRMRKAHCRKPRKIFTDEVEVTEGSLSIRTGDSHLSKSRFTFLKEDFGR